MTPAKETIKATLTIYKNLPWSQRMLYTDAKGAPIDVSLWDAKLVVRDSLSGLVLHTFSKTLGTIILGNGRIELQIPDAATVNAFTWLSGVGHLVLEQPGELPKVIALFSFVVQPSTTDSP